MQIREAQKHADPDPDANPDPQHCCKDNIFSLEEMFKMFYFSREIVVWYITEEMKILDFLGVILAKHGNNFSVCYKESVLLNAAKKLVLAKITICRLKKCSKCLIFHAKLL
jgi:hypothetical protein